MAHRAEQSMRERTRQTTEADAKFRALFDQGAQFAGILSVDGELLEANRMSLEACGFQRSDVIGKPFWECGWWSQSPEAMALIREGCAEAASGRIFERETGYFLADGSQRMVHLTIAPVIDPEGQILFLAPTGTDITERTRAEQALRASQAESERQRRLYEAILTNTPDLAYVFDLDHRFIYANDVLLRMWGRTWDEAIGKTCLELGYEPWHAARHDREIDQVVFTRMPVRGEVPFTGTFGRRIYDYIFVPVFGANGEVEAVAGTTRDVTARKQADAERETLLARERAARTEAERANLFKDEFLAMLSHELRTPLNAVVGWTELLRSKPSDARTLEQGLAAIDRNARMQTQLVSDLLDMSRSLSGKMRIEPERVDLRLVIERALESVRSAADAQGVALEAVMEPLTDIVYGDPVRLQQVVGNLLSNAVRFTPRGGHVRVTLRQTASQVEIVVGDSGRGINPEFLPHVFERFRQADTSTTREHGGLGLGLAIVKQLVDLHGGVVAAASPGEGRGATFTVRLPCGRRGQDVVDDPTASIAPIAHDPPDLGGVTVLVVDDEPDARDLVGYVLAECGARVVSAGSAAEALSALDRERPDVILSDIGMPQRDGYAFMTEVRLRGIKVPAAALTAFVAPEDRTRALRSGYQAHIAKPVGPGELIAAVAALANRAAERQD
jgi:PAS domain S-box-containing protein